MDYHDIIALFGTPKKAAHRLKVTPACISYWKKHGISKGRQQLIEFQTRFKLKADSK